MKNFVRISFALVPITGIAFLFFNGLWAKSVLTDAMLNENVVTAPVEVQNRPGDVKKHEESREKKVIKKQVKKTEPLDSQELQKIIDAESDAANIEFNFENAGLKNVLTYISELFNVSFLPDDAIEPMVQGKGVSGNKITFKSERPMTKKEVWNLFTIFLDMAGLSMAQTPKPNVYRITSSQAVNKMPLVTYIGTPPDDLPDNDTHVRYVYFLSNASIDDVRGIIDQMRSQQSEFSAFIPLKAIILTDKAYNIKSLMKIVIELDKASLPEMISVIKLKYTDAKDVKDLFDGLTKGEDPRTVAARIFGAKRQSESFYFSENTRMIAEPRTNTLVVFGTEEAIKKIEEFVEKVDTEFAEDESPFYIYELQFTDALSMAEILNKVTAFGIGTAVGQAGGVRDGEKYFKAITFSPEKSGNRLIVKGDYEDWIKAKEIIKKLDVMQPQIAIEVLIVNVSNDRSRAFGSGLRNKRVDTIAKNVNFQNSGFNNMPPVVNSVGSIMANLISLAQGNPAGTTLLTLGAENNIWAIFRALSNEVSTSIVSNPFLLTTNKYKATVELGETRRVQTGTVISGSTPLQSINDLEANLTVVMTPQINSDGIITLDITIDNNEFTFPVSSNPTLADAARITRHVDTQAALADKEVLAIGGLVRTQISETITKVPILGSIPLLGWFFKNKEKLVTRSNLLIFISPEIVQPKLGGGSNNYTKRKAEYSRKTILATDDKSGKRDPIDRWFFNSGLKKTQSIDNFMEKKYQPEPEDLRTHSYYRNRTADEKPAPCPIDESQKYKEIEIVKEEQSDNAHALLNGSPVREKGSFKRSLSHFIDGDEGMMA